MRKKLDEIDLVKMALTFEPVKWDTLIKRTKELAKKKGIKLQESKIISAIWQCIDGGVCKQFQDTFFCNPQYYTDEYSGLTDSEALRKLSKKYLKKDSCKQLIERIAQKLESI